ncbi:hypothetical protein [Porphyromonas sp. COT-108 OH2963]|uniref:hypothetical protein n=1 Tax=Porphyromonas sp. COT-108 OH2963 TaxID=1515614 RepID=UPI001362EEB3|nr:hypothetical protein [Porphyromonas sp. COT-108 OH2963]
MIMNHALHKKKRKHTGRGRGDDFICKRSAIRTEKGYIPTLIRIALATIRLKERAV